ncbi:unnamed protein product, partial [Ectocarpus fasciculatus]
MHKGKESQPIRLVVALAPPPACDACRPCVPCSGRPFAPLVVIACPTLNFLDRLGAATVKRYATYPPSQAYVFCSNGDVASLISASSVPFIEILDRTCRAVSAAYSFISRVHQEEGEGGVETE